MSLWVTVECDRALYVHEGINRILCDRLPSPITLVLKLKEKTMAAEELKRRFQVIDQGNPITQLANILSQECTPIAAQMKMSRMDFCSAMANAIGIILFDASKPGPGGKPMPREEAIRRMDDLRQIMLGAYDLSGVKGEG